MLGMFMAGCANGPLQAGTTTVFEENPGDAISKWSRAPWALAVPEGPNGRPCLRIRIPTDRAASDEGSVQKDVWGKDIKLTAGQFEIKRPLDLSLLRGWRVNVIAHVRTAGVTKPEVPWEGVRIGLNYETPLFVYNTNINGQPGDSDWHDAVLANARIPEDAVETSLNLGLIANGGTLWVDNIRIVLVEPPLTTLAGKRAPFIQKTQRRGAGIATATQGIRELAKDWNLNVVKWWLRLPSPDLTDKEYNAALEKELAKLDLVMSQAEEANIKVIPQISNDWKPEKQEGGPFGGTNRVYIEPEVMNRFIDSWKTIARRYAGRNVIEGYDLSNETVLRAPPSAGCRDWEGLAERAAQVINDIDPKAQIFVQPEEWWGVQAFTKLRPINAKNITYSVHMYAPFELTHQRIKERQSMGVSYPSVINGRKWDKEALRRALQPARDFQLAYGVPMQVGEFSCIRWAPDGSSARWFKDTIDIFEEYGWDWTFHALRDWDGWTPELGEDPKNVSFLPEPPAAKKVLLEALARNIKSPLSEDANKVPPKKEGSRIGDVVCKIDFDNTAAQEKWTRAPWAKWVKDGIGGATVLAVDVPSTEKPGHHKITMPFDVVPYRGMSLHFECMAKAENVSKPPQPYNGVKFMMHFNSLVAGQQWRNQGNVFGTFDWKKLSFVMPIADDATNGDLYLGLEECTGKAWFKDIEISVARAKAPSRPPPMVNPPPPYKGHDLSRLRGVMSPNQFKDEELRVLGQEWNANLIRWQITKNWGKTGTERDIAEYDKWIDGEMADLDKALDACEKYGIKVVIDLHSPPGGRYEDKSMAMTHEKLYQDHFVKVWEKIASRYKDNKAVWAYDLINEPMQGAPSPEGLADYLGIQVLAARAIRKIDPDTCIIIEADQWDSPPAFPYLEPVDINNVVYQAHMYFPYAFTHQGVYNKPEKPIVYPGLIDGKLCDKEALRKYLQPVRDFQLAYNAHIYIGEFSAIRWAPGNSAYRYLKDCIEIFEEYGWDWSYHAFREWDGWSLEHGPDKDDKKAAKEPGDRLKLFLDWFGKNEKPK
jgi:aryl-phospho-beta-D-glucosidase BglC (GH1 family)